MVHKSFGLKAKCFGLKAPSFGTEVGNFGLEVKNFGSEVMAVKIAMIVNLIWCILGWKTYHSTMFNFFGMAERNFGHIGKNFGCRMEFISKKVLSVGLRAKNFGCEVILTTFNGF